MEKFLRVMNNFILSALIAIACGLILGLFQRFISLGPS